MGRTTQRNRIRRKWTLTLVYITILLQYDFNLESSLIATLKTLIEDEQIPYWQECLNPSYHFWLQIFSQKRLGWVAVFDPKSYRILGSFQAHTESEISQKMNKMKSLLKKWQHYKIAPLHISPTLWLWIQEQRFSGSSFSEVVNRLRIQKGTGHLLEKWHQNAAQYLPYIVSKIQEKGLPLTLAFLPFIESGFDNRAQSKAGAKGVWQIMALTFKDYYHIDLRHDAILSTEVALKEIEKNYRLFKNWFLAITAYNTGRGRIHKVLSQMPLKNTCLILKSQIDPDFGFESQNFYAELLALRATMKTFWKKHLSWPSIAWKAPDSVKN